MNSVFSNKFRYIFVSAAMLMLTFSAQAKASWTWTGVAPAAGQSYYLYSVKAGKFLSLSSPFLIDSLQCVAWGVSYDAAEEMKLSQSSYQFHLRRTTWGYYEVVVRLKTTLPNEDNVKVEYNSATNTYSLRGYSGTGDKFLYTKAGGTGLAFGSDHSYEWRFITAAEYQEFLQYYSHFYYQVNSSVNLPGAGTTAVAWSQAELATAGPNIAKTTTTFPVGTLSEKQTAFSTHAISKTVYYNVTSAVNPNYVFLGWANAASGQFVSSSQSGSLKYDYFNSHDEDNPTTISLVAVYEDITAIPEASEEITGIYYWRKNASSADWNDCANWLVYNETGDHQWHIATQAPTYQRKVCIQATENGAPYPIVAEGAACDMIYMEAGARMGHQERLSYNQVFMDVKIKEDRWVRMCSPLQNIYTGDFVSVKQGAATEKTFEPTTLGGNFSRVNNSTYQSVYADATPFYTPYGFGGTGFTAESETSNWSEPMNILSYAYPVGVGYDIWMANDADEDGSLAEDVLLHFPSSETSYYYYYMSGERTDMSETISRSNSRFAFEGNTTVSLSHTGGASSKMFAVGNPSVAYLDIRAFLEGNAGITPYLYRQEAAFDEEGGHGKEKIYYLKDGRLYVVNASVSETTVPSGSLTEVSAASADAYIDVAEGFRVMSKTLNAVSITYTPEMFAANLPQSGVAYAPKKTLAATDESMILLTAAMQQGTVSSLLVLQDSANAGYCDEEDAPLYDVQEQAALFGTLAGNHLVGVNVFEELDTIPLYIASSATLSFANIEAFGIDAAIYDAVQGVYTLVSSDETYDATVAAGQELGRYYICHMPASGNTATAADNVFARQPLAFCPAKGSLLVNTCSEEPMMLSVYSATGVLVENRDSIMETYTLNGLSTGTYILILKNATEEYTLKVVVY